MVPVDNLLVISVRPIFDQPTFVIESSRLESGEEVPTGILSVSWELLLSNNGIHDLSVVRYDLLQIGDEFAARGYTDMNQGVYKLGEGGLFPFPVTIAAGETIPMYLRIGIQMDDKAYRILVNDFPVEEQSNLQDVINFLRDEGLDFYGNSITENIEGAYIFPPIDQINEQIFGVSFETSREAKAIAAVSWYEYGIYREIERRN